LGVVGDDLPGMFFSGLVVTEPGVAVGGVENPFRVVEHKVVFRVLGFGHLSQQLGTVIEAGVYLFTFFKSGVAASLLEYKLYHAVGRPSMRLARLGIGHNVVISTFGQGEPGSEFVGPGDDFAVPGLKPGVVGRLPSCFSLLSFA